MNVNINYSVSRDTQVIGMQVYSEGWVANQFCIIGKWTHARYPLLFMNMASSKAGIGSNSLPCDHDLWVIQKVIVLFKLIMEAVRLQLKIPRH